MIKYTMTYEKVTWEEGEELPEVESGFSMPGGWEFALQDEDGHHIDVLDQAQAGDFDQTAEFEELVKIINGYCMTHDGQWFYETEGVTNYTTGEETRLSLHVDDPAILDQLHQRID